MRIVFLCDTMGSGGAERVISSLSNQFVSSENDVYILMISNVANGSFYFLDNRVDLSVLSKKKYNFFKKSSLLRKELLKIKPDVVIAFLSHVCIYTWWALRYTNIPYIVSERNDPNQRNILKQFLLNCSFKKSIGCVFQTSDAFKWYESFAGAKSTVIYNPVSLDCVSYVCVRPKKQILFVGRLSEQKNCFMLLEAFKLFLKKHTDYQLKMYGSGPLHSELKQYINKLSLDNYVIMLPSSKTWQKDEYESAVFVLPSKYEGMPNVLAEALCLGIPSVSTNCTIGGPKELAKLFPTQLVLSKDMSAASLCEAMEVSIKLERGKPHIPEQLDIEVVSNQWLTFINQRLTSIKR